MTLGVTNGANGSGHEKSGDVGASEDKGDNGILGSHIAPEPIMPILKSVDNAPPTVQPMPPSDLTAIPFE